MIIKHYLSIFNQSLVIFLLYNLYCVFYYTNIHISNFDINYFHYTYNFNIIYSINFNVNIINNQIMEFYINYVIFISNNINIKFKVNFSI